jgi:predicted DNA-binding protein
MTISLRLDAQAHRRLEAAARESGVSKSELVRRCLEEYLSRQRKRSLAWEAGKDLFGKYGSGEASLSANADQIVRKRIHAKARRR